MASIPLGSSLGVFPISLCLLFFSFFFSVRVGSNFSDYDPRVRIWWRTPFFGSETKVFSDFFALGSSLGVYPIFVYLCCFYMFCSTRTGSKFLRSIYFHVRILFSILLAVCPTARAAAAAVLKLHVQYMRVVRLLMLLLRTFFFFFVLIPSNIVALINSIDIRQRHLHHQVEPIIPACPSLRFYFTSTFAFLPLFVLPRI